MRHARFSYCKGQTHAHHETEAASFFIFFRIAADKPPRSLILDILQILAILLQTERMRGTGPRATGTGGVFFVAGL